MYKTSEMEFKKTPLKKVSIDEHPEAYFVPDVVDTTVSFARNFGGYCRSDIAVINEQNNGEVAMALIDRLTQLPSDGKTDVSDRDLRMSMRSRYCQTPSEQCLFIEQQMKLADDRQEELAKKSALEADKQKSLEERKKFFESMTEEERAEFKTLLRKNKMKKYAED